MKKNKKLLISIFLVLVVFILEILIIARTIEFTPKRAENIEKCKKEEIKIVRGRSLEPLILAGTQIKVLLDYYQCQEIKKNDLVLYNYAGNEVPLLKIIKAIPQDIFELVKTDNGYYNLFINEKITVNSQKIPYIFSEKQSKMLSLYEKDYKGIIPKDTYLLLGDQINGTTDSTVFGLVNKSDILGKAIVE